MMRGGGGGGGGDRRVSAVVKEPKQCESLQKEARALTVSDAF